MERPPLLEVPVLFYLSISCLMWYGLLLQLIQSYLPYSGESKHNPSSLAIGARQSTERGSSTSIRPRG